MGSLLLIFLDVPSLAPGSLVDSFDFRCGNSKARWRHVNSTSTIGRPLTEKAGFIRVSPVVSTPCEPSIGIVVRARRKLGATRQVFCLNDSGLTARINQWVVSVESAAYLCDVRHTASVPQWKD